MEYLNRRVCATQTTPFREEGKWASVPVVCEINFINIKICVYWSHILDIVSEATLG